MGVAAENRWARKNRRDCAGDVRLQREREVIHKDMCGEYAHIEAEADMRRELGQALVKWEARRPHQHDYATKAEAVQAAREMGGNAFPLRCFTAFESFWTVGLFSAAGWQIAAPLSVEGTNYVYRPATPDEVACMGFRKPPTKSVFIACCAF